MAGEEAQSDVVAVWLEKAAIYRQQADGSPALLDHLFLAELGVVGLHSRYAAEVTDTQGRELARFASGGRLSFVNEWLLDRQARSFASLSELDAAIPNDVYRCHVRDAHGERDFALALGGGESRTLLPAPPRITLSQGGRAEAPFDADAAIEVAWTPFSPAPAPDGIPPLFAQPTIFFLMDNCRGETVFSSGSGARRPSLSVDTHGLTLPAGTLEPGLRYTVFVSFIDYRAGAQSADGAVAGVSVHSATVECAFETGGEAADGRSCPPIEQRACYRWPGPLKPERGLAPWPVSASGLTIEPAIELRSTRN
ncbi:hypothetical protein [Phenylobacterium sp.]|uniref:hypothetical protein n=1 Tax=Phenylobacterium sp. TaxID=1871053 RepID=UPI0035AD8196